MKFLSLQNRPVNVNITKYKIDWNSAPSKGQLELQNFLYPYWKDKIILSEFRIPKSLMRIDLLNCSSKICIEYSPKSHHGNFNPFFHGNRIGYYNSIKRDAKKEQWVEKNGFTFIELDEKDIKENLRYDYFVEKFGVYL